MFIAAQCYWEEGYTNKILMNEKNKYKISVGKYTNDLSMKDNNFTQIIDVSIISWLRTKPSLGPKYIYKNKILGGFCLSERGLLWPFWVLCR